MPAYAATLSGPEHRVSYANAAFQRLLGDRPVLGLPNAEAVPEAVGQGLITALGQVYASGQALVLPEVPLQLPQAPGELRQYYLNVTYQPLPDAQGRPQDVLAFGVDVTEQVLARQQAAAADAELRLLTAHAPAFLFRTDAAGSLVYLNESFFAWTGLEATRLRSLDEGWAVVHPGDLAAQQPGFVAAVQAGQPWQSTPYRFRRRDGQYRWMLSRSQPLLGAEGQVLGQTDLTFEVHEQVELQQQLERTNQDEMIGHLLDLLDNTIGRFQFTIAQLTDLSKLQLAHAGLAEPVNLAEVVEGVRLDLGPVIAAAEAQLTVDHDQLSQQAAAHPDGRSRASAHGRRRRAGPAHARPDLQRPR
nr:hypothetical protein [Tanacetum cinerariifolium]